jgi:hypothetical protein
MTVTGTASFPDGLSSQSTSVNYSEFFGMGQGRENLAEHITVVTAG